MGIVYRLAAVDGTTLWVGATRRTLAQRMGEHVSLQPWAREIFMGHVVAEVRDDELVEAERDYARLDVPKYGNWNPRVALEKSIATGRRMREKLNGQKLRNDLFAMSPRDRWYIRQVCSIIEALA